MASIIVQHYQMGTWEPGKRRITPPEGWIVEISHVLNLIVIDTERQMMVVPDGWEIVGLEPAEPPIPPPEVTEERFNGNG